MHADFDVVFDVTFCCNLLFVSLCKITAKKGMKAKLAYLRPHNVLLFVFQAQ